MKILIVDDSKENLYLLEALLKGNGYQIISATNGAEALEKLRADDFDMIISDILMPVMDGFKLCQECKRDEHLKGIFFVFYTATYVDEKDEELALSLGADKFIRKPIEPDEFMSIIKGLIRDAEADKSARRKPVAKVEKDVLKLYSERLVNKLEKKVLDLETEIARRKQVEEMLQKSERKYRTLVENLPHKIFLKDKNSVYISCNENYALDLKIKPDEIAGKTDYDFYPRELAEKYRADDREILESGKVEDVEEKYSVNGQEFYVYTIKTPVRDESGEITGIMGIFWDITEKKRTEEALKQSTEKLLAAMNAIIEAMALTVEMRDPYTAGHQRRVTKLAVAIATEMGLPEEKVEGLRVAATVHDIGKINVPAEILSKPAKLNEVEFNLVKLHSQAGYDILKGVEFPWPIAPIVLQHHERLDGSGYPQGLKSEDILFEAKILAVADVVEAMASHRPYRPALGIGQALDEISHKSGILYDSEVVDACFRLFYDKEFKLD